MAKHRTVWVNASSIVLEVNSTEIRGTKFGAQRACFRLGHFTLDNDIAALAAQFFLHLRGRKTQFLTHEIDDCLPVSNVRRVGHYRLNRNVMREYFVIGIEDRATFCVNDLLINVFFSGKPGVFFVLDCLQIDQTK